MICCSDLNRASWEPKVQRTFHCRFPRSGCPRGPALSVSGTSWKTPWGWPWSCYPRGADEADFPNSRGTSGVVGSDRTRPGTTPGDSDPRLAGRPRLTFHLAGWNWRRSSWPWGWQNCSVVGLKLFGFLRRSRQRRAGWAEISVFDRVPDSECPCWQYTSSYCWECSKHRPPGKRRWRQTCGSRCWSCSENSPAGDSDRMTSEWKFPRHHRHCCGWCFGRPASRFCRHCSRRRNQLWTCMNQRMGWLMYVGVVVYLRVVRVVVAVVVSFVKLLSLVVARCCSVELTGTRDRDDDDDDDEDDGDDSGNGDIIGCLSRQ